MTYEIKKYSYDVARQLGVQLRPSTKGRYKIDVLDKDGKYITSIGDSRYADYPTFLLTRGKDFAEARRRAYHSRHYKDNGIRGIFAIKILW